MTIAHHPTEETLAAFAAGRLHEAEGIVVAAHLRQCAACRSTVAMLETAAGVMLEALEPVAMSEGALENALAKLNGQAEESGAIPVLTTREGDLPAVLRPLLSGHDLGPWRRIGLGLKMRSVSVAAEERSRLFMLQAEPGTKIPHHRHTGREWTCVVQGAFRHEHGRFGPGDFDEADDDVEHHPFVEEGERCICLVAMSGGIELQGWLGRMIQPLVRL